jgi:hypothetical protein
MAFCPGLLYPLLVLAIVRIVLPLGRLPAPSPFALAGGSGTEALLGHLRAWPKELLARLASPEFHGGCSPHEMVMSGGKIGLPECVLAVSRSRKSGEGPFPVTGAVTGDRVSPSRRSVFGPALHHSGPPAAIGTDAAQPGETSPGFSAARTSPLAAHAPTCPSRPLAKPTLWVSFGEQKRVNSGERQGRQLVESAEDMKRLALGALRSIQKLPELVKSFFRQPERAGPGISDSRISGSLAPSNGCKSSPTGARA